MKTEQIIKVLENASTLQGLTKEQEKDHIYWIAAQRLKELEERFKALPVLPMNEAKAREILGDIVQADNTLDSLVEYVDWPLNASTICLDGDFTADELEAFSCWMRNKGE